MEFYVSIDVVMVLLRGNGSIHYELLIGYPCSRNVLPRTGVAK